MRCPRSATILNVAIKYNIVVLSSKLWTRVYMLAQYRDRDVNGPNVSTKFVTKSGWSCKQNLRTVSWIRYARWSHEFCWNTWYVYFSRSILCLRVSSLTNSRYWYIYLIIWLQWYCHYEMSMGRFILHCRRHFL